MNDKSVLREEFIAQVKGIDSNDALKVMVVAVELPSKAIEIITNTSEIVSKIAYYMEAYDDKFRLKNNQNIRIVGFMLV
jgi:sulfite reductase beta subunit-like hemoprotein